MSEDRQMTEDELIDMKAHQCVDLSHKIDDLLMGQDMEVCITVLNRMLIHAAHHGKYEPQEILNQFLNTLADVYEIMPESKPKEDMQ